MRFLHFVGCLNENNKALVYRALAEKRSLSDSEWKLIETDVVQYKEISDAEEKINLLLNYTTDNEKERLMSTLRETDPNADCLQRLYSFEEIGNVDDDLLRDVLKRFSPDELAAACKGTSPENKKRIMELCGDVELEASIITQEPIAIVQIEHIQREIVDRINDVLGRG